jgi:hypothetical protein
VIERVAITGFSPDVQENNPSVVVNCSGLYSTTRGLSTLSVPDNISDSPLIKYNIAGDNWYPQIVGCYNAHWLSDLSTLFVATERVPHPDGDAAHFINGAIFKRKADGSFEVIYYKNDTSYAPDATPSITEAVETFDLSYKQYISMDQYGDYAFIAHGGEPIFITSAGVVNGAGVGSLAYLGIDEFTPKFVARAGTFVFLACGGTGDDDAGLLTDETYWRCSVDGVFTGDPAQPDFTVDTGTLGNSCVSNNVRETPGPIIGMKALDRSILIYKERSVFQLNYVGPPLVWSQSVLTQEAGALSNNAIVDIGGRHVFMGHDDFYYVDGQSVKNLPNPVKDFILGSDGDIDKSRSYGVLGHYDRNKNTVFWYYPSNSYASFQIGRNSGKPVCDKWVAWNYLTDIWTIGEGQAECSPGRSLYVDFPCYPDMTPGDALTYFDFGVTSLNSLTDADPVLWGSTFSGTYSDPSLVGSTTRGTGLFSALATDSDSFPMPVERDEESSYISNAPDTALETGLLSKNLWGVPPAPVSGVPAKIRLGDFGDGINYKFVRGIRPVFSGRYKVDSVTCTVYTREDLDTDWRESSSSTAAGTTGLGGESPYWISIRSNARYHQFKLLFTGMAELSAIDIDYDDIGSR